MVGSGAADRAAAAAPISSRHVGEHHRRPFRREELGLGEPLAEALRPSRARPFPRDSPGHGGLLSGRRVDVGGGSSADVTCGLPGQQTVPVPQPARPRLAPLFDLVCITSNMGFRLVADA